VILAAGEKPARSLAEGLFKYCEENLAAYKIPRIIEFVEALPKTISGKIRRVELRTNEATSKVKKEKKDMEFFHTKY
jgi:acyl-coenzyme A synthetase/AMP-(fatty) acid ligase